jgi:hypothetical protein
MEDVNNNNLSEKSTGTVNSDLENNENIKI